MTTSIEASDLADLRGAKHRLEHPGLAIRLTNLLGKPLEKGFELLPARVSGQVHRVVRASLLKALAVAVGTLDTRKPRRPSDTRHRLLAIASGGAGGFFGLPALAIELPVSTTILLRSIADHARSQGEDLASTAARLACLEVFAFGGRRPGDDAAETGYFAVRAALARAIGEAAQYLAKRGLVEEGAPAIARLITSLASRFAIPVSEKAAAQAVPIVGALGGAAINAIFIDHFQSMARGHFTVRRLERKYGVELVRRAYETI